MARYHSHHNTNYTKAYTITSAVALVLISSAIVFFFPPTLLTISLFILSTASALYLVLSLFLKRTLVIIITLALTIFLSLNAVIGFSIINTLLLMLLTGIGIYLLKE